MPHIETPEGIRIRYDERGPEDGRPLVLAHGFSVSLEMWMPQMQALSQEHRLITWDTRGHGGSSAPDDIESYTRKAASLGLAPRSSPCRNPPLKASPAPVVSMADPAV